MRSQSSSAEKRRAEQMDGERPHLITKKRWGSDGQWHDGPNQVFLLLRRNNYFLGALSRGLPPPLPLRRGEAFPRGRALSPLFRCRSGPLRSANRRLSVRWRCSREGTESRRGRGAACHLVLVPLLRESKTTKREREPFCLLRLVSLFNSFLRRSFLRWSLESFQEFSTKQLIWYRNYVSPQRREDKGERKKQKEEASKRRCCLLEVYRIHCFSFCFCFASAFTLVFTGF